jgi:transcription initiation factor IIE alpha subunit
VNGGLFFVGYWTFVTNHAAVLSIIAKHGRITATDIALQLGITERSVRRIIADLLTEGYIDVNKKKGSANKYYINTHLPLRRPELRQIRVRRLIDIINLSDETCAPGADIPDGAVS